MCKLQKTNSESRVVVALFETRARPTCSERALPPGISLFGANFKPSLDTGLVRGAHADLPGSSHSSSSSPHPSSSTSTSPTGVSPPGPAPPPPPPPPGPPHGQYGPYGHHRPHAALPPHQPQAGPSAHLPPPGAAAAAVLSQFYDQHARPQHFPRSGE